jgi:Protein of unknown function (DUF1549)/Protein of unknown function (DUF1553)
MRSTLSLMACFFIGAVAACGHEATPPKTPANTGSVVVPALTSADIDSTIETAWKDKGITPSARADDATYLRRVYLDLTGTLPPPERALAFVADTSKDKRQKLVDELLASDGYSDHWMAYWDDVLMGDVRAGDIDRQAFRVWLHDQLAKNVAWDKLAYDLITATGKNSSGGQYGKTLAQTEAQIASDPKIDGAVNYVLKYRDNPQDMAGATSKIFLGVQIQCAQCHDHKKEKWKQTDFRSFATCFMRTQLVPLGDKGMKGIKSVEVRDLQRPAPRFNKNMDLAPIAQATPTALDGTAMSGNTRQAIAAWITKNPWFAEEITNRMWGHFLGRGFTNPVDDVRASNPPDMPDLMKRIAKDFTDHGSDLKRLMRLITQTEVYQLSAVGAAKGDIPLWSQFRMTPLGPEELVNALIGATGTQTALEKLSRADIDDVRVRLTQLFSFAFDVDEEMDTPRYEGTLTQALVLLNGKLVAGGSSAAPTTAINAIARSRGSDADKVEAIYLRTLARKPTQDELAAALSYIASATAPLPTTAPPEPDKGPKKKGDKPGKKKGDPKDPAGKLDPISHTQDPKVAALEDIMWATLNSSEFVFNH